MSRVHVRAILCGYIFFFLQMCMPHFVCAQQENEETLLKFYGCIDITSAAEASKAILSSKISSVVSIKGGYGGGIQLLVPLSPRVNLGGEFGFILTSVKQHSSLLYYSIPTDAAHSIGFSPLIGLLQLNFGHVFVQGGIGLSIYKSFITFNNAGPELQSISSTDTWTGGCAMAGGGIMVPVSKFLSVDFSVKYYSTFVSINNKTYNDVLLMPGAGIIFRF